MLTFINSGLMTSFTDMGRVHSQVNGYSQAGAIDWFSYQLANALIGNELDASALEIVAGNVEFIIGEPCFICVAGARCELSINDKSVNNIAVHWLNRDDRVKLGPAIGGVFTYIAFSAQFDLPLFKGSVCAVKREKVGGPQHNGSAIKNGQAFAYTARANINRCAMSDLTEHFKKTLAIPVISALVTAQFSKHKSLPFSFCYQDDLFANVEKQRFIAQQFNVTQQSDKMGVRLQGCSILCKVSKMTSQPMANGAIQIPSNGQPIIMRNERQTIGGYPVIGSVSSAGLAILSQATPQQLVSFVISDMDNAQIWRQFVDIALKQVLNKAVNILSK